MRKTLNPAQRERPLADKPVALCDGVPYAGGRRSGRRNGEELRGGALQEGPKIIEVAVVVGTERN